MDHGRVVDMIRNADLEANMAKLHDYLGVCREPRELRTNAPLRAVVTAKLTMHWKLAAVAVILAGLSGAPDGATRADYVATGACRDGAANGAYELRMPDGRLRILGAFAKGRRTGTFLFWASTGARIAVVPYDDDAKVGTVALWYAPATPQGEPRRKLEAAYAGGVRHGLTRSWHANGRAAGGVSLRTREPGGGRGLERIRGTTRRNPKRAASRSVIAAADAEFYASLERTIAENGPRCD